VIAWTKVDERIPRKVGGCEKLSEKKKKERQSAPVSAPAKVGKGKKGN